MNEQQEKQNAFNAELTELCKKYGYNLTPDFNPQFVAVVQLLIDGLKNYPPIVRINAAQG
jgi:hypothetical protein